MHQTQDFKAWLDSGGAPLDEQDVFDLWAAMEGSSVGRYDAFRVRKSVFVSTPNAGRLHIAGIVAMRKCKSALARYNPCPDLGMDGAAYYSHAMQKLD